MNALPNTEIMSEQSPTDELEALVESVNAAAAMTSPPIINPLTGQPYQAPVGVDPFNLVWRASNGFELWVGNRVGAATFTGDRLCVLEEPHCWSGERTTHIPIIVDGVVQRARLNEASELIDRYATEGRALLLHCSAGMERSPLTCAWWLVKTGKAPDLDAAYAHLRAARPIVADRRAWIESEPLPAGATEREKYEAMWSHDQYRTVAPGEQIAPEFLNIARPRNGAKIIDFGSGTGRGARAIAILANVAGIDVDIEMLDFADNALDEDVAELCKQDGTTKIRFTQHDLTKSVPMAAEYGFNTDVMEHIPPEQVDLVLTNILQAARHVFFQISCVDDACGKLIGHALHLSVHEPAWWKKKFEDLGCTIHYWRDDTESCVAYVTAWANGQDIVDAGVLNEEIEVIRSNVRTNLRAGWHQIMPHPPQSTEVMIIGGGPSLAGQLDTIRRMRFEGKKIVTLNGAYNWAIENGLGGDIGCQVVVDARPHNARFVKPVQPQAIYLIGSQCDPSLLEGLPKERTLLWHTTAEAIRDILEEERPGECFGVQGGSTVLLRTIPMLRMLGYMRFHLFGCDSCLVDEKDPFDNPPDVRCYTHHAYIQSENDGMHVIPVTVGGRVFHCHPWMASQATEFMTLIAKMGDLFEIQVHGDGLLGWILQHGAQVDIDLEEAREASER